MENRSVVVVAAHPDDEILGCGGTMARHSAEGDDVHVIFMADGVTSRNPNSDTIDLTDDRNQAAYNACETVGAKQPQNLGFPDNRMDSLEFLDLVQALGKVLDQMNPQVVYTHHAKDLNVDHQLTHQAVMTACRPQPGSPVSEIYSFEILSSTGWGSQTTERAFVPNCFVDVTATWARKRNALQHYREEMRPFPHARSMEAVEALAKYRGSSVGVGYAEAFQLERMIRYTGL